MILITGGTGFLGKHLKEYFKDAYFPTRKEMDIKNIEEIEKYIIDKNIKTIIHCAAFIGLFENDNNIEESIKTNIIGTSNIAIICNRFNIKLIYISTDYVFDGEKGNYKEEDKINPKSKYAISKACGELITKLLDKYLIIRCSFFKENVLYKKVPIDQVVTRDFVDSIAKKIYKLFNIDYCGIIHIGRDKTNLYRFIKKEFNKNVLKCKASDCHKDMPKKIYLNLNKQKEIL